MLNNMNRRWLFSLLLFLSFFPVGVSSLEVTEEVSFEFPHTISEWTEVIVKAYNSKDLNENHSTVSFAAGVFTGAIVAYGVVNSDTVSDEEFDRCAKLILAIYASGSGDTEVLATVIQDLANMGTQMDELFVPNMVLLLIYKMDECLA